MSYHVIFKMYCTKRPLLHYDAISSIIQDRKKITTNQKQVICAKLMKRATA